ncbi:DUF4397 domain-containing protein [Lacibacter sp.]|uniref:DUF4397 domain-containing protein n=1 Tax=Lacibacter sp. TaxID=1915409 RepID=UPI002B4B260B|nr:DUF4397 domain-containing protein [Lacibacter sp.]HLP38182.1 DUF4397 domain-containing protein [Lacibacter sp.]
MITSCKKEDEGMDEMKDMAKVVFVNATVNNGATSALASREVGIYPVYNGLNYNNHPIQFPFTNGYKAFPPPTLRMQFDTCFSPGTSQPNYLGRTKVMEFNLPVQADNYYSLFSVGTIYNVDTFFVRDDVSLPTKGKARIICYNLSIDAGPIDIVNSSTGQVVYANLAYKARPAYIEIDPGNYRFQINAAGTSTVLRAARDLIIDANSVYTIWARGMRTPPAGAMGNHPLQLSYHANRWSF